MAPEGNKFIDESGKIINGRGIPPSVVENAIKVGAKAESYGKTIVHIFQNVKVVTDEFSQFVITVIKTGK